MSLAKNIEPLEISPEAPQAEISLPPTDLYSDEPPLETYFHLQQMMLLLNCLDYWWRDRDDYFSAGNLTIYYNARRLKSEDFRGPDFFVVLDTERKPRKSWMVWEEDGKYPNIIVEILSDSTASVDRGLKKQIYQDIFRTPDYFWFDPDTLEFAGFSLISGQYQPIQPTAQGWMWSQQLQLYLGVHNGKLRYFTANEEMLPTPAEDAIAEQQKRQEAQQQAEQAQRQAEQAQQQAEQAQRQAEQAQQQAANLQAQLARYQAQFGDLPDV